MPRDSEDTSFNDGLETVTAAETVLSDVDGAAGRLTLRGHLLEQVAGHHSFEWLTGELWRGFVDRDLREPAIRAGLGQMRATVFPLLLPLLPAAANLSPLAGLRLLVAATPDDAPELPLRLLATVAVGLPALVRQRAGQPPVAPNPTAGHAADVLAMLHGAPRSPLEAAALDSYLVTAADHGLNASTFAARVTASTRASLVDAVTAALCALKGPLHGGAPGPVLDMLDAIGAPENAETWLDAALQRGDRLMGFGHRVYRVRDPRSDVVKAAVASLGGNLGRLAYAEAVERAVLSILARRKPTRSLQTNLEFYTALLLEALGLPRDAFTGAFAIARTTGWIAHALEQQTTSRLIRPRSRYVGPAAA